MTKRTKRVFSPEIFVVTFGGKEYDISPQPISRVIEFQQAIEDLFDAISGFQTKYVVSDVDGKELEVFDTLAEAELVAGDDGVVSEKRPGVSDFLNAVVSSPYYALKVMVPDLLESDVKESTFPELKNALDAIIEVNGIGWLETFLKKTIGPVMPEVMGIIISSTREALTDTIGTET